MSKLFLTLLLCLPLCAEAENTASNFSFDLSMSNTFRCTERTYLQFNQHGQVPTENFLEFPLLSKCLPSSQLKSEDSEKLVTSTTTWLKVGGSSSVRFVGLGLRFTSDKSFTQFRFKGRGFYILYRTEF